MMSRSRVAAGRMMAAARRAFHSQAQSRFRSRPNLTIAGEQQPMNAYEVKRAKIFKQLEEIEVKTQREIVEDVEKVKRMESEDRNLLNRLLTSCGVPKGSFEIS